MSPSSGDVLDPTIEIADLLVSIQLMSPASGDSEFKGWGSLKDVFVSIQLMSPASGDSIMLEIVHILEKVSIQLMSPASGD